MQGYRAGKLRYPAMPQSGDAGWLAGYMDGWRVVEQVTEKAFGWKYTEA